MNSQTNTHRLSSALHDDGPVMDDHGGGVTRNGFYQISLICNDYPKTHRDRERQLDSRHLRQIPIKKCHEHFFGTEPKISTKLSK